MAEQIENQLKSLLEAVTALRTDQTAHPVKVSSEKPEAPTAYNDAYFKTYGDDYIEFTYANPTIYHVVQHFATQLSKKGFSYLSEKDSWEDLTPGKYYTYRNGMALIAFVVGQDWTPEKGVAAIGSHIDALTAPLKPSSIKDKVEGYELLGVAPYGGTLGELWWDRDLGVGGRLLVRDPKTKKTTFKLVDSTPHPVGRIPTLAPHFGAPAVGPFNKETQAVPVVGFSGDEEEEPATEAEKSAPLYGKHSLNLLRYISSLADVAVEDIVQWDLQLYDVQKGAHGGLKKEFIFAPRVDDRICSFSALNALIDADTDLLLHSDGFSLVSLVADEEIGSGSRQGAKGKFLELVVLRVLGSNYYNPNGIDLREPLARTFANTFIISADVIHLVNPNFANVYLEHHKPVPNKGISVSLDSNGHMATDSTGLALVEELGRINGDELQYFQIRNDSRSGGTIGPEMAAQTGARTIDMGIPQFSMHSIRAAVGSKDVGLTVKFFKGFFANWRETYDKYGDL